MASMNYQKNVPKQALLNQGSKSQLRWNHHAIRNDFKCILKMLQSHTLYNIIEQQLHPVTVKLTLIICKESRDAINLFSFTSLVLLPFLQNYPVQNGRVPKILKSFKTTFVKLKFLSLLILHAFALNDRNKNIIVSDRDTSCFQLIFVRKSSKILCRNELC